MYGNQNFKVATSWVADFYFSAQALSEMNKALIPFKLKNVMSGFQLGKLISFIFKVFNLQEN